MNNTPIPLEHRIADVELRLRNRGLNKRALRREAARVTALLELRDHAYRRLVAYNAKLEADRRTVEAIGTAVHAYDSAGYLAGDAAVAAKARLIRTIREHLAERGVDHELIAITAGEEAGE